MEFHDQSLQFTNKYYFQLKDDENNTASTIYTILLLLAFVPIALAIFIGNVVIINIDLAYSLIEYMQGNNKMNRYIKEVMNLPSLLIVNIAVNLSLIGFHICALIHHYHYDNEIFYSRTTSVINILLSIICFSLICITGLSSYCIHHAKDKILQLHIVAFLIMNIMYLGTFFVPYILLAFIHNPLQTIFYYLVIAILVVSAYLLCVPFSKLVPGFHTHRDFCTSAVFFYVTFSLALSVIFLVMVMFFILTLGSFNDFEEVQNLLVPLLVAVFGVFILKSTRQVYTSTQDVKSDGNGAKEDIELHQVIVQSNNANNNQSEDD